MLHRRRWEAAIDIERPPEGFNPRTHPLSRDIGRTTLRSYHTALLVSHILAPASGVDLSLDNDEVTQEHIFSGIDLTLANALCEGLSASRAVRELPAALPPSLKSGRQGACEAAQRRRASCHRTVRCRSRPHSHPHHGQVVFGLLSPVRACVFREDSRLDSHLRFSHSV